MLAGAMPQDVADYLDWLLRMDDERVELVERQGNSLAKIEDAFDKIPRGGVTREGADLSLKSRRLLVNCLAESRRFELKFHQKPSPPLVCKDLSLAYSRSLALYTSIVQDLLTVDKEAERLKSKGVAGGNVAVSSYKAKVNANLMTKFRQLDELHKKANMQLISVKRRYTSMPSFIRDFEIT